MIFLTQFVLYLIASISVVLLYCFNNKSKSPKLLNLPPSPVLKLPIIGHLHLMSGYEVPYQAFTELSKKFGDVYSMQLGSVKCVVVNGQKNIREALVTKGHHFDSRPNFDRYQMLFSGNKENSLAFCDWSKTQKIRRDMLKAHTFPRTFTNKFYGLEELVSRGTQSAIEMINENILGTKPIILRTCANIFTNHFCSKSFHPSDSDFNKMIEDYDEIFYEVNQGYAADFLPFLLPFHTMKLKKLSNSTHNIRQFMLKYIIGDRLNLFQADFEPNDYVESLVREVKFGDKSDLTWELGLFTLEDIIGGHSAVGNFLIKVLAFLAKEPEVQSNIQQEIDSVLGSSTLTISHRASLPYTEATIYEAIRLIASPIVPRVANCDSSIKNFDIEQGSLIFLNNYDLSMSASLWSEPTKFDPNRFVKDNALFKPEHFLPFGGGRRSCMGYKMVQLVSFGILGGLLQKFVIKHKDPSYTVPVGNLALPKNTFNFIFEKR